MPELSFSLFGGLIQIVAKGVELPLPLSYGLLILLIGIAIRIAVMPAFAGVRQLLQGIRRGVSLIRGTSPPAEVHQKPAQRITFRTLH